METIQPDERSAAAAEFARAAVRCLTDSGVPPHRFKAMAELLVAEMSVAMDREFEQLAKRIDAAPDQYTDAMRKEMVRAALASGVDRVRATLIEQAAAWSEADPARPSGDRDNG